MTTQERLYQLIDDTKKVVIERKIRGDKAERFARGIFIVAVDIHPELAPHRNEFIQAVRELRT